MSHFRAEASKIISASPEAVYAVLADYEHAHAQVMPEQFFESFTIIEGGYGAGTVVDVGMNVFGAKRQFRLKVFEPEPGRILSETDETQEMTTSFLLDPVANGGKCHLTIQVDGKTGAGLLGVLEKWFNPAIMRHIFRAELEIIEAYMVAQEVEQATAV